MVLHAAQVGEAQVDEFDLVILDEFFDVFDGHGGSGDRSERLDWKGAGGPSATTKASGVPILLAPQLIVFQAIAKSAPI
ncbi:hypothetical protein GCM10027430_01310 [Lysobacter tyrosinilyticus]